MRFSRLSLERYGRFEDCELNFRSGRPDFHIIYGANEAGKTTSLAAVSDLLFGFQARSPYNFLFDYSLLRIGAILEDGERSFSCRRKKGASGTLLDENDAVISEAPLLAMLKGQTRETFSLSFSLDQDALRLGGRAMIEAKNDVGRALFAAGSGLTGVSEELKKLEADAESIWGPTTKSSRTFTKAQRQYTDSTKLIRDQALKPKAWSDAKAAGERTHKALEDARGKRNAIQEKLRVEERIRRLAPIVREREEQLKKLNFFDGVVDIGRQREDTAEELIKEAENAVQRAAVAESHRRDIAERRSKVSQDPSVLNVADEIDLLLSEYGVDRKAAKDLVGLKEDGIFAAASVERLRVEAGSNANVTPERAVAAKLRDLARIHGEHQVANRQITESRESLENRRKRAQSQLEKIPTETGNETLVDAIDAARALGSDADDRVDEMLRKADTAAEAIATAINQLAPWAGNIDDLVRLPIVGDQEIDLVRQELAELLREIRREEHEARSSADLAEAAMLEIEQIATGTAVSPDEVHESVQLRQKRWLPIRDYVLEGSPLLDHGSAIDEFEASIAYVDERMEQRFNLAEASSKLTMCEKSKASHELVVLQATKRATDAQIRHGKTLKAWLSRLSEAGLPLMEPSRFQTWQADRTRVEKLHSEHREFLAEAERVETKRNTVRSALAAALGIKDAGGSLASVSIAAERRRTEIEEDRSKRRLAQSELEQIEIDAEELAQKQKKLDSKIARHTDEWNSALAETGLELDAVTCSTVIDLLDELREKTNAEALIRSRIDSIVRDAQDYATRVGAMADRLGVPPGDVSTRLQNIKERLTLARSATTAIRLLEEEDRGRAGEVDEANAKLAAAEKALASLLSETGSADRSALSVHIERSRARRTLQENITKTDRKIVADGDGLTLDELVAAVMASDLEQTFERVSRLEANLEELNGEVDDAATAYGDARSTFAAIDTGSALAVNAAADAAHAKSELENLAEDYILKRAQAVTLKWAIEKYRERHQDPLLLRAGELFSILTMGRYATLKIDADGAAPRLLGLRDDGRTMIEVDAMSEGTTDQLFLALRLAALEQSVSAGVNLPFLADDLFVNFDDQRAEAGIKVLAAVAQSTQVLFFTHHPHLVDIAKSVVGPEMHSECVLR